MKYCSACGGPVSWRIPPGDNRERHVCDRCQNVHYRNPRLVVGCVPVAGERILLCRRAIDPRRGYWTLPAGFLEVGETMLDGARRETWEEAHARVDEGPLYTMFDLPHIAQVHAFYLTQLVDAGFSAGAESLEVALFDEQSIPWRELAFPVIDLTLQWFFDDRRRGTFPAHFRTIRPEDWGRLDGPRPGGRPLA